MQPTDGSCLTLCHCRRCRVLVTTIELLLSFGSSFFLALRTKWSWLLVAANSGFALITYSIAIATLKIAHGPVSAVVCGILFPAILRSRYTLFKTVEKGDTETPNISVPLDKMYAGMLKRCYREIDSRQAAICAIEAKKLDAKTSEERLLLAIKRLIAARLVVAEREADEKYLGQIVKTKDDEMRRYLLALFLIAIAGGKEEDLLS